jgi:hypothetical protein
VCSSPDIPDPGPPPQESKTPDTMTQRRRQRQAGGMAGGTVLTGASGVQQGTTNTGTTTLLGS